MNAKHTPGPWSYWPNCGRDGGFIEQESTGMPVAVLIVYDEDSTEASGYLMAAAPELLDVAMSILADDMLQYLPAEYVAKVRATIAKATGEQ
jgi:hypothetical protein